MKAFNAINKYRRAHWLYKKGFRFLPKLYELRIYKAHNCFVPSCCELGDGTIFGYKGIGCVIGKKVVVGQSCMISQNVTIGGRGGMKTCPELVTTVISVLGQRCLVPSILEITLSSALEL